MTGPAWSPARIACTAVGAIALLGGGAAALYGWSLMSTALLLPVGAAFLVGGLAALVGGFLLAAVPWLVWMAGREGRAT